MGLRSTFSETRVRSMALTLRYPYPPSEAVNAPAARTRRPGKHVIEPSEHAGLNRSINRVFSLSDRRRRPAFRPVSKKTSAPCYPGGLVWRKRKGENAVDGSVAGGSGADV